MDLPAFVGKLLQEQDGDVLRAGVRVLAQGLMEAEVTELVGAEWYERTEERTAHRNGSRARTWDTRVGMLELTVPKVRPSRVATDHLAALAWATDDDADTTRATAAARHDSRTFSRQVRAVIWLRSAAPYW